MRQIQRKPICFVSFQQKVPEVCLVPFYSKQWLNWSVFKISLSHRRCSVDGFWDLSWSHRWPVWEIMDRGVLAPFQAMRLAVKQQAEKLRESLANREGFESRNKVSYHAQRWRLCSKVRLSFRTKLDTDNKGNGSSKSWWRGNKDMALFSLWKSPSLRWNFCLLAERHETLHLHWSYFQLCWISPWPKGRASVSERRRLL